MGKKAWKDWTIEQWQNASYCDFCGLPLLEFEDANGEIKPQCVYCTWTRDEQMIHEAKVAECERKLSNLGDQVAYLRAERAWYKADADVSKEERDGYKKKLDEIRAILDSE